MVNTITVEVSRAGRPESEHHVHAVLWHAQGGLEQSWGQADRLIYPRSSAKMIQALPLVESGAAATLGSEHLALACASHSGGAIHTDRVARWLKDIERGEGDLRCGSHIPSDRTAAEGLVRAALPPTQCHNNCSGKHTGFLTLTRHLNAGPEYIAPDHPIQQVIRTTWEEVTEETSPGFGIDGCSAPNHMTSLSGMARAMAGYAASFGQSGARAEAQQRLVNAMMAHPDLVAGEGRACTGLMRAMAGKAAVKTGAEGVYIAILPEQKRGITLKAACGTTRAAEAAIAALLCHLGVLDPEHPAAKAVNGVTLRNHAGVSVGAVQARLS